MSTRLPLVLVRSFFEFDGSSNTKSIRAPEIARTHLVTLTETRAAKEEKADDTDASRLMKTLAREPFKIFISFRWIFG